MIHLGSIALRKEEIQDKKQKGLWSYFHFMPIFKMLKSRMLASNLGSISLKVVMENLHKNC